MMSQCATTYILYDINIGPNVEKISIKQLLFLFAIISIRVLHGQDNTIFINQIKSLVNTVLRQICLVL